MDIQSIAGSDGQEQYFFYYPDEIVIYLARETRLEKYFPVQAGMDPADLSRPALRRQAPAVCLPSKTLVLTAGNNFSPDAQVLAFRDNQWQEIAEDRFCPLQISSF